MVEGIFINVRAGMGGYFCNKVVRFRESDRATRQSLMIHGSGRSLNVLRRWRSDFLGLPGGSGFGFEISTLLISVVNKLKEESYFRQTMHSHTEPLLLPA